MKALALLSGGLDSTLAIKVLLEQGLEVEAVNFTSPFCLCSGKKNDCHAATGAAAAIGVKLHRQNCGQDYLETIAHPRYGYGRGMNPCLDCRIFKLNKAKALMAEIGASFLVTGEVLGQRPMSQRRDALDICERDTGLRGLILRPLSARLLRPTIPEENGWVDRDKLLAISGRGRTPQIALASELGVADYPCPGGGCLLTYKEFAAKLQELLAHGEPLTPWRAALLRVGRHFRLPGGTKLIVGRHEEENMRLAGLAAADTVVLVSDSAPGPTALAYGPDLDRELPVCGAILAHYADLMDAGGHLQISCRRGGAGEVWRLESTALEDPSPWLIAGNNTEKTPD